jgi:hypothetical protein
MSSMLAVPFSPESADRSMSSHMAAALSEAVHATMSSSSAAVTWRDASDAENALRWRPPSKYRSSPASASREDATWRASAPRASASSAPDAPCGGGVATARACATAMVESSESPLAMRRGATRERTALTSDRSVSSRPAPPNAPESGSGMASACGGGAPGGAGIDATGAPRMADSAASAAASSGSDTPAGGRPAAGDALAHSSHQRG